MADSEADFDTPYSPKSFTESVADSWSRNDENTPGYVWLNARSFKILLADRIWDTNYHDVLRMKWNDCEFSEAKLGTLDDSVFLLEHDTESDTEAAYKLEEPVPDWQALPPRVAALVISFISDTANPDEAECFACMVNFSKWPIERFPFSVCVCDERMSKACSNCIEQDLDCVFDLSSFF